MPNHLIESNSPYLLQHANNPVDWHSWGQKPLQLAKREDKPIFLSIGYAACHWCHVMAHESFENEEIAAIMNEHFINIKVDREERPDLDDIYMNAVVAMTGQGGWPLSVFLTPDGKPFFGGTYFPPVSRYNIPSFRDVLLSVARSWREERERITEIGGQLTERLERSNQIASGRGVLEADSLQKAAMKLAQTYDWKNGGWGQAPKFPQPMAIEFLINLAASGDKFALEMVEHVLNRMAKGGMYDVIGGGFARYSTDDDWLVPHFEKMLYDNAQLSRVYLYGYLLTGEQKFREVCEWTLAFVMREMTGPQGGYYSSLDADSEGEEGKFYTWTWSELEEILENSNDFDLFTSAFGVTKSGNFEGTNVLQRVLDDAALSQRTGMSGDQVSTRLDSIRARLLSSREARVRPGVDDKVLVSWNCLMVVSFLEAGKFLGVRDYVDLAIRNIDFILDELHPADRLLHSWRNGKAQYNAYLDDYASLILSLVALYQADPDVRWYAAAENLVAEMIKHFKDPEGGFFDTGDDHEPLITRPIDVQDNATPSGNALAATALLYLAAYTGRGEWRDMAEDLLCSMQDVISQYPLGFGKWLCALDLALNPIKEVAIIGNSQEPATKELTRALWSAYRPHLIAAISDYPPASQSPELLEGRRMIENRPTAYVCQNFVCLQPATTAAEFAQQLETPLGTNPDE
ncbi:MAG TPA: thioredoxin domain-containing protein [Anaerolineales bacterium]|nr:thioredoxin domain-containing protein [Anaerolineales bacterium]